MAVLDGAPLYATPDDAWNVLLLVLNCGGGDAARRLAGDRDSLSTIRTYIKFAPDWAALELALRTECPTERPDYSGPVFDHWALIQGGDYDIAAVVVEYARFLRLFKGVPHGFLSPPPSWPVLYEDTAFEPFRFELLNLVWKFHSKRDSYAEDCVILTGREIPYYQYHDSPTWSKSGKDAGLMGYRRMFKRYAQVYGTPPSNVWPDVTALVVLAGECQSHLDEWRGRRCIGVVRDAPWHPGGYVTPDLQVDMNTLGFWNLRDGWTMYGGLLPGGNDD